MQVTDNTTEKELPENEINDLQNLIIEGSYYHVESKKTVYKYGKTLNGYLGAESFTPDGFWKHIHKEYNKLRVANGLDELKVADFPYATAGKITNLMLDIGRHWDGVGLSEHSGFDPIEEASKFWSCGEKFIEAVLPEDERMDFEPVAEIPAEIHLLLMNVCGNKDENFKHLMEWLAWRLKHPTEYLLPAINIYGVGGVGKTLFAEQLLSRMFTPDVLGKGDIARIAGGFFNGELEGKVLMIFDESSKTTMTPQMIERLKTYIGSSTLRFESKGRNAYTARSTLAMLFFTNNSMGSFDLDRDGESSGVNRRYSVIKVNESLYNRVMRVISEASESETPEQPLWLSFDDYTTKLNELLGDYKVIANTTKWIVDNFYTGEGNRPKALHGQDFQALSSAMVDYTKEAFEYFKQYQKTPFSLLRDCVIEFSKHGDVRLTTKEAAVMVNEYCAKNKFKTSRKPFYKWQELTRANEILIETNGRDNLMSELNLLTDGTDIKTSDKLKVLKLLRDYHTKQVIENAVERSTAKAIENAEKDESESSNSFDQSFGKTYTVEKYN